MENVGTCRINLSVHPELKAEIERICLRDRITQTQLINTAIDEYLSRNYRKVNGTNGNGTKKR